MKIFWFDTETTGLDPHRCGIHQISGLVEINGSIAEEFNLHLNPLPCTVEPRALAVSGKTEKVMEDSPPFTEGYKTLKKIFERYIDKFDKEDKFFVGGYNVRFDIDFLAVAWKRTIQNIVVKASPKQEQSYQAAVIIIMSKYFESCDIFEEPMEVYT